MQTVSTPPQTLFTSLLSDFTSPVALFAHLSASEPSAFLLESTESDSRLARYSFIGIDPLVRVVLHAHGQAIIQDCQANTQTEQRFTNPLDVLRQVLEAHPPRMARPELPFSGGLVGYLSYGATAFFENIPQQAANPYQIPLGIYGLYDTVIAFDHLLRRIVVVTERGDAYQQALMAKILAVPPLAPIQMAEPADDSTVDAQVTCAMTADDYRNIVAQCKDLICRGEVFQIVPAQRFTVPLKHSALAVYRRLMAINPSPYAYFIKFPEVTYLGSSPETCLSCQNGKLTLKALAGTRHRGATEAEDQALANELRHHPKELAEHKMLVDLGRNDLGRVCNVGSIQVGEIAQVVRYTHVMHLATEISGQLRPDKTIFDAFKGCFPRGTVSGAPKIRAMELLAQLEPEQRGIYSGAVGYFDRWGNSDHAIAIRSAVIQGTPESGGQAHVTAGAGVVYDSDPEFEYQETRNKARSVLKALG
jgi:anthranilate synthase component 1